MSSIAPKGISDMRSTASWNEDGSAWQGRAFLLLLLAVYLLNVALRLPGALQELPPLTFCDEDIFLVPGYYQMLPGHTWRPDHVLSGGINFYAPVLAARIYELIAGAQPSMQTFVILARAIGPIGIGAMLPVFLMLAAREISRRDALLFWVALVGTLSPLALAISRVAYPDHTTAGVAAVVVWLSVRVTYRPLPSIALFVAAGALVGLLASLKYSGIQVALLFAAAFALSRTWSDLKAPRTWLAPVLCAIAAIAVFVATNPYVLTEPGRYLEAVLWHRERYGIGQPGSEANNAYLFYSEIVGFGSFGIVAAVVLVVGIYAMARRNVAAALSLAGFLAFFIVSLGGYRVATNRNIMAVVPIALLFIAFGIAFVLERLPRATRNERIAGAALIALFCAEPAWRVGVQLRNDLQKEDSRAVARAWIAENIPAGEAIGYGPTCWSYPFDPARNPVVDIRYNELRKVCLRHYVLTSWFYEHWGLGNNPISWPNMSDHMHVNVGGVSYAGYRSALDDFLKGYRLRQTFSEKRYYGPSVYVFERINACPS